MFRLSRPGFTISPRLDFSRLPPPTYGTRWNIFDVYLSLTRLAWEGRLCGNARAVSCVFHVGGNLFPLPSSKTRKSVTLQAVSLFKEAAEKQGWGVYEGGNGGAIVVSIIADTNVIKDVEECPSIFYVPPAPVISTESVACLQVPLQSIPSPLSAIASDMASDAVVAWEDINCYARLVAETHTFPGQNVKRKRELYVRDIVGSNRFRTADSKRGVPIDLFIKNATAIGWNVDPCITVGGWRILIEM